MITRIFAFILSIFVVLPGFSVAQKRTFVDNKTLQSPQNPRLGFMIHGGAGVIAKGTLTAEKEKAIRADLERAVVAGYKALQDGKSALDAVEAAIRILEDSPHFNAGKGAVFTSEGKNELDASIMDGKTLGAGAVAGLRHIKNPITLARAVMEKSKHVMMIGEGAEKFAREQKLDFVDEKYFWTQERWDALQKAREAERVQSPKSKVQSPPSGVQSPKSKVQGLKSLGTTTLDLGPWTLDSDRFGTVGAVALDRPGNLAAGTSTGGMTNKKYGRVGDAPIIGAGTYANNNSCAVSATGWGEYFIRLGVARDIAAIMEYQAAPVQTAADRVIQQKLKALGGDGGVIAMDKFGNMAMSFNSPGMYRAYIAADGKPVVQIY